MERSFEKRASERIVDQVPDVDPEVFNALFDLFRAANRLIQDFEANVHGPLGISWAGYRILFIAWVEGPIEPRRLSRVCGVSRATVTSVLHTLERDGFVERERSSDDGRLVTVTLTRSGRALVKRACSLQHAREKQWFAAVTRSRLRVLTQVLRNLLGRSAPDSIGEQHPEAGAGR